MSNYPNDTHIIYGGPTPSEDKRQGSRRESDRSMAHFINDETAQFQVWQLHWRKNLATESPRLPETLGFCEGNMHAHATVLNMLGVDTECPCSICFDERRQRILSLAEEKVDEKGDG